MVFVNQVLKIKILHNLLSILGVLTQRWKMVQGPIVGDPKNIEQMIAATCVLHNYLCINNDRTYLPPGSVDAIYGQGDGNPGYWRTEGNMLPQAAPTAARNHTANAANARAEFTDYFCNEGAVEWQYEHIHRRSNRQ